MVSLIITLIAYLLAFILFLFNNFTTKQTKTIPYTLLITGFIFYVFSLIEHFVQVKTFPVGDIYGMLSFIGNLSVLIFVIFSRKYNFSIFGTIISFIAFLTTVLLIPSKKLGFSNPLYILHIFSAGLSYTFLIFAGLTSFAKLLVEKKLKEKSLKIPFAPLRILKSLEKFFIIAGFIGLTLTLIFGSLWAKDFLGTHWINDTKLLTTLLLWTYYAFLSHMYILKIFKPSHISFLSLSGTALSLIALLFFRHSF
ncbi:MAG TPA: hypothetical protein EYG91_00440 [Aquifex aeolicus]|nr:hypothetical protein [Aquifex aeolicus]